MAWRPMAPADLAGVEAIGHLIHVAYPEDGAVFVERLALFPEGCLVLEDDHALVGYVLSHPWRHRAPPALNARLGRLPADADCLYIHDLAVLPDARGRGAAGEILRRLAQLAATMRLPAMALISIAGTSRFWERQGFIVVDAPELSAKLASYDADARLMRR
ncbi:MAG: GNAT family N-acetyltransferase, partial [Alphaproteobacteria bacterium]|nr:GNAT family N-acetyltransferase [Alphaproteobacteria bacterium]